MDSDRNERPNKSIETRFKIGNKAAEKWTEEEVYKLFEEMYVNVSEDDEILCFSDACLSVGYRDSHVDYFITKFPVFEIHKKDVKKRIVSRINKEALQNNYNPTASIWRMKQLGERDEKYIDQTTQGDKLNAVTINTMNPDGAQDLINKLNDEE